MSSNASYSDYTYRLELWVLSILKKVLRCYDVRREVDGLPHNSTLYTKVHKVDFFSISSLYRTL